MTIGKAHSTSKDAGGENEEQVKRLHNNTALPKMESSLSPQVVIIPLNMLMEALAMISFTE